MTSEDDKYLMRERSKKGFGEDGFHVWARMTHHSNMIERRARDMTNLTDFVNGRAEGLERGRLICWPVLISAKIYQVWFEARVIDEEHAVELHRTDSVEELDSLDDLREHERFRTHGDVDAITGHLLD